MCNIMVCHRVEEVQTLQKCSYFQSLVVFYHFLRLWGMDISDARLVLLKITFLCFFMGGGGWFSRSNLSMLED